MRRRTAAAAILLLAGSLSACAAAPATPTPRLVSVPTPAWQTSTIPATAAPVASVQTGSLSAVRLPAPAQRLVPPSISVPAGLRHQLEGIASYYWQDQMTASGEKFDKKAMTAAHKTLPLGTKVRVTNPATGRSVVVRINDRGPYKPGRIIDLSEAAARELQMTDIGLAKVTVQVLR